MKTLAEQGPLVILLNGPKQSGKTTAAKHIVKHFDNAYRMAFAEPLKAGVHASLNIQKPWDYWDEREDKDSPNDEFYGLSPRQGYIEHSENYMKKVYGGEIFSKLMTKKILEHKHFYENPILVIADCGFQIEYEYVKELISRLYVIRIDRPNYTFADDSRGYIENVKSAHFWWVNNDSNLTLFNNLIYRSVSGILNHDERIQKETT